VPVSANVGTAVFRRSLRERGSGDQPSPDGELTVNMADVTTGVTAVGGWPRSDTASDLRLALAHVERAYAPLGPSF